MSQNNKENLQTETVEPIAIIGIGCRFPGEANSPETFWKLLQDGVDAITEVPADRWNLNKFYDPNREKPGKVYTRKGGFIKNIDQFDPLFFGISPREAAFMDPQQRLLLETAWEALEDAGQLPEHLAGKNVGVFVGQYFHDYQKIQLNPDSYSRNSIESGTGIGSAMSISANRISYFFNFTGPSLALDTACSSALVAVHLACRSIWNGESTLALAAGVNIILVPEVTITMCKASMLSPDGYCKSFDARADGFARAEGAGIVVLKPLSQAIADKDSIYAVIRGSAVNQDGRTNGITVPNGLAQEAVILDACRVGGVSPEQIQYVEAHGTGTPVGDPIEAKALGNVLGKGRPAGNYCFVGSVKTNMGHLESAAGIVSLIKVALALKHQQIPPNLHFETPNPNIPFEELQLRVPQNLEPWSKSSQGGRFAAVNSFGIGGTNAHVILEGAETYVVDEQPQNQAPSNSRAMLLPLSARTSEALKSVAKVTYDFLTTESSHSNASLSDICYSASLRRSHHDHRLTLVGHSQAEMAENLQAFLAGEKRLGMSYGRQDINNSKLVFVFAGIGPQWWAMGRQLLEKEAVFRQVIEQCDELLQQYADWSLMAELTASAENSRVNTIEVGQPLIFAVQVALAALWRSWGVLPDAIVGHSLGEVAAAYVAGVLSLPDAIQLIFYRSRLLDRATGKGKMLAVGLSAEQVQEFLVGNEHLVGIAAINSPKSVTLSGVTTALEEIAKLLEQKEIFHRFVRVDAPGHSKLLEFLKSDLIDSLQGINPQVATVPLYSTVTGQRVQGTELDPTYWFQNVRQTVLFADAINEISNAGYHLFLEISAHPVLAPSISECFAIHGKQATILPSLRRQELEQVVMLGSFGQLHTLGYLVDWNRIYPEGGKFVKLPFYPWEKERYWHESLESQQSRLGQTSSRSLLGQQIHPLLGCQLESAQPVWDGSIDKQQLSYLNDHRVQGTVLFPASGYIEMGLAAAKETFSGESYGVGEVQFQKALFLLDDQSPTVQLVINPTQASFEIYSKAKDTEKSWVCHAIGKLIRNQNSQIPQPLALDEIQQRSTKTISQKDCYQLFQAIGLEYGPCFQGIEQLFCGQEEALGQLQVNPVLEKDIEDYQLHPAILDACFQVLLGTVSANKVATTYLPTQIDRIQFYNRPGLQLWSYARLVEHSATSIKGDIHILDETGNVLVKIQGLYCRAVEESRERDSETLEDDFYQYQWRLKARPDQELVHSSANLPSMQKICSLLQPEAIRLSEQFRRKHYYEVVEPQFDLLCLAYILQALDKLGWQPRSHERVSVAFLENLLNIESQHQRLLVRMLEILQDNGVLETAENGWWQVSQIPELKEAKQIWKELITQYPSYQAELTLVGRCGDNLADVLRGEVNPLELIFSEGTLATSEHFYHDAPNTGIYNFLVQKAIMTLLEHIPKERTIRILEIGAGTGSLTSYVLPKLPVNCTEYVFTDISQVFLTEAAQKFVDYPFIEYQVLDIEADPRAQGFIPHSFDVILASNVIHATSNLRQSLENVKQLLASEGLFIFIELTKVQPINDLIFGLLKGWWLYSDLDLRPKHPLLVWSKWRDLLAEVGFAEVTGIADIDTNKSSQTVILAKGIELQQNALSETIPAQLETQGSWLIFADSSGVGLQLAGKLQERSETAILISPGTSFQKLDPKHYQIRVGDLDDMQQLLEAVSGEQPHRGIVHLWSLNAPPSEQTTIASLESIQQIACISVLNLVQALAKANLKDYPHLFLVTGGSQTVGSVTSPSMTQSLLWGLGRTISNEQAHLNCKRIDISPTTSPEEIQSLFEELWLDEPEDEIALRGQVRYVNRLRRIRPTEVTTAVQKEVAIANQSFHLEKPKSGVLDDLTLQPATRRQPNSGEVEIQVHTTGLNFKDVLRATSLFTKDNLDGVYGQSLGLECAGTIVSVGSDVEGFEIGDEVIAFSFASLSAYTTTNAKLVVHKPKHLSLEQAATVPLAFVTAYYALHYLGKISKGERVLIHAASGGVGLAAIQIAQLAGAEVFATASTPEKREFLRSLGVNYVMDSRSLDFADEIAALTHGEGIDIVLNTLPEETIAKSLSTLRMFGRFIDIANVNNNSKLPIQAFQKSLSFFAFDLEQILRERLDFAKTLFCEVIQYFDAQTLHPLPHRVFPLSRLASAFKYIAQAKHIGKFLVSWKEPDVVVPRLVEQIKFRADGTYMITGGLSGFGLAVAQWLVEHGARHLVLMGRSGATSLIANSAIEAMRHKGAEVVVVKADVTVKEQVKKVLDDICQSMPPLRGIFHSAMVLEDAILLQLNQEQWYKVTAPKIVGAWNLHTLTLDIPLDLFVLFSSASSVVGQTGQGNYVAANIFLDTLAHYRRAQNLPALTVNWGSISDVGYVSQNKDSAQQLERLGAKPLPLQLALKALGELIQQEAIQTMVTPINWQKWFLFNPSSASLRLAHLGNKTPLPENAADLNSEDSHYKIPLELEPAELKDWFVSYLCEQVAKVLGTSASKLDSKQALVNMGIDSLMALELRNLLNKHLGVDVPTMKLMQGLNIDQLAIDLIPQVQPSTEKVITSPIPSDAKVIAPANDWIVCFNPKPQARLRLFCFPYMGGSVSLFRSWSNHLPSDIEVYAVMLPGSIDLLDEQPFDELSSLVEKMAGIILPYLDKPFVFYGHSIGSLISFELTRQLRREHGFHPIHLLVAAFLPPHLGHLFPNVGQGSEAEINQALSFLDIPKTTQENTALMQSLLPTFKAGFLTLDRYTYSDEKPFDCPISIFGGTQDRIVPPSVLEDWKKHTSSDFKQYVFPGNHLFLHSDQELLLPIIADTLTEHLKKLQK
ncbi:SDR family NAD(P)-dependent oxidoreductase [Scytonema sp. PRP1]|uniref:SDR family NAD(P)-dependent oxidoreductase n=1 Tax=Scytonema sp. PRP1 TaxID=3120513 RepID=UPI002FD6F82C